MALWFRSPPSTETGPLIAPEIQEADAAPMPKTLPFDVRYALQHKKAQMGRIEIAALIESGYDIESFYLIARTLRADLDAQAPVN